MDPRLRPHTPVPAPDARAAVLSGAVVAAAGRLKLKTTELTAIIGVSQPTASRLLHGTFLMAEGTKPWELAAHLVRLYRSLFSLGGGDDERAQAWLRSANVAFGGRTPVEVIRTVDGLVHACDYLDAHRARV